MAAYIHFNKNVFILMCFDMLISCFKVIIYTVQQKYSKTPRQARQMDISILGQISVRVFPVQMILMGCEYMLLSWILPA